MKTTSKFIRVLDLIWLNRQTSLEMGIWVSEFARRKVTQEDPKPNDRNGRPGREDEPWL